MRQDSRFPGENHHNFYIFVNVVVERDKTRSIQLFLCNCFQLCNDHNFLEFYGVLLIYFLEERRRIIIRYYETILRILRADLKDKRHVIFMKGCCLMVITIVS